MLASTSAPATEAIEDPCDAKLPPSLRALLTTRFPGFRTARLADYLAEDIEEHKKNSNGDPCLGIASTDVDGDGFPDFAFLLANGKPHAILVAARHLGGKTWELSVLTDFGGDALGHSYVDTIAPDSYEDLYASDRAPADYVDEPGRVRRFKAKYPGFIAGTIEASGVAFFYSGKRWVHLWLSD
jgi:hypothetical protein